MLNQTVRMIELAQQGFHCSQILVIMGLINQGKTNSDLVRSVSGLAGGLGFSGDTCGALTGGACLLGLYAGRGEVSEEEDPRLSPMIVELVEWFAGEYGRAFGGTRCETILGNDPRNRTARCPSLVLGVYEKVNALLVENGFDLAAGRP